MVGRNPTVAMALAGVGHDVSEIRPSGLTAHLQRTDLPSAEAVLIDRPDAEESLGLLAVVRESGLGAPVLLLAGSGPDWAALDPASPGGGSAARLLALPVAGPALAAAVDEVLALSPAFGPAEALPPVEAEGEVERGTVAPEPAEPEPVDPAAADPEAVIIDLRAEEDEVEPVDVPAAVRTVLGHAERVYGVPESAAVVLAEARRRVRADAAALLVADGERWRLAATEDVGDAERGEVLLPSSWLASTMGTARRGLVVEHSDLARERLQGAPLARRRHLLISPVWPAPVVLLLARSEDPDFAEDDVTALVSLAEEAGPLLAAALDARALARTLTPLRDIEPVIEQVPGFPV